MEEKDQNSNIAEEKVCSTNCGSSISFYESLGPCSNDVFPSNNLELDTGDNVDSLQMQQKVLIDNIEHKDTSCSKLKSSPSTKNQSKALKSDNLRVCFASMNEELHSLDYQWSRVEEMLASYEKCRSKIHRDIQQCRKDIDDLLEKEQSE